MTEGRMSDETRDHASEEKVGELLKRHAGLYHDPPAAPREAMWARIEAARRRAGDGDGRVIPLTPPRWWLGALAIAAVLALGVVLGRISMREESERRGQVAPPVAEAPGGREPETGTAPPAVESGAGPAVAEELAAVRPEPEVAPEPAPPAARPAASRGRRTPAADAPAPARPSGSQLYRLASQQMLGQAEALLLQYRSDRAADRIDPAVGRWARDVLSSTRLLLDSPAADDPGMRDLLQDLELVLAQIVQRTGQTDPLDDAMIDRTIEDRALMPRIRGAIPAGVGAI